MNARYWLFRRNGIYYLQDSQTRQKESLRTFDRQEAVRIRDARNEAAERPGLGIALAKAYLTAHDPEIAERTWQNVLDEFCSRGHPHQNQSRTARRTLSPGKPRCSAARSRTEPGMPPFSSPQTAALHT